MVFSLHRGNNTKKSPIVPTESPVDKLRRLFETSDLAPPTENELAETWAQIDSYMRELFSEEFGGRDVKNMEISQLINETSPQEDDQSSLVGIVTSFCDAVTTIGNAVANGVSTAFAPATPCFAGVAILLSGVKVYVGIVVELQTLLRKCIAGLENLRDMHVNHQFALKIQMFLSFFLSICCEWKKIRMSHRERLKAVLKTTFLKDSVVQTFTAKLDELRKDRNDLALNQMHKAIYEQNKLKDVCKTIVDGLCFNAANLDQSQLPVRSCLGQAYADPFDGTGYWIQGLQEYKDWRDGKSPVLFLTGSTGEGKTFAMANIVKRLLKQGECVLYYFESDRSGAETDDEGILGRMVRSIIWQCACANSALASSIARLIREKKPMKSLELWKELLLKNETRKSNEIKLYILIDTISSISGSNPWAPFLQSVKDLDKSGHMRILMTSTQERHQDLSQEGLNFNAVYVPSHSQSDLDIYANVRMDKMETLSKISNPNVVFQRNRIMTNLRRHSQGDWTNTINVLDMIQRKDRSPSQIDQALLTLQHGRQISTQKLIGQLESDLNVHELREICTVILWVKYGQQPPSVDQLDWIVSNRWPAPWIEDFDARLKRYSIFDCNQFGEVGLRSREVENYVMGRTPLGPNQEHAVLRAQVEIVKHAARNICPDAVFDKLGLGQFLDSKLQSSESLSRAQGKIYVDHVNGHLELAWSCLSALVYHPRRSPLVHYAGHFLLHHLENVDFQRVDPSAKEAVAIMLATLFTRKDSMSTMFALSRNIINDSTWENGQGIGQWKWLEPIRQNWLYTDRGCKELSRWFRGWNPLAGGLSDQSRQIITAFSEDKESRYDLLFATALEQVVLDAIIRAAKYITAVIGMTHSFLVGFQARRSGKVWDGKWKSQRFVASLDGLRQIETLMANFFKGNLSDLVSGFYFHMGMIYLMIGERSNNDEELKQEFIQESRDRFAQAQNSATDEDLRLFYALTRHEKVPEKALPLLEKLLEKAALRGESQVNDGKQKMFDAVYVMSADAYWKMGPEKREKAKCFILKVVEMGCNSLGVYIFGFLEGYIDAQDWPGMITLIEKIYLSLGHWESGLEGWLIEAVTKPRFWIGALQLAVNTGNIHLICEFYEKLLGSSKRNQDDVAYFLLMRTHGLILESWTCQVGSPDMSARATQILEEALGCPIPPRDSFYKVTGLEAVEMMDILAKLYLRQEVGRKTDQDWTEYGRKLEGLAETHDITRSKVMSCAFAAYYKRIGHHLKAKHVIRTLVRQSLEMLSDHDSSNDSAAFQDLAMAMSCVHDDETLVSVCRVLHLIALGKWIAAPGVTESPQSSADCPQDSGADTFDSTQDSETQSPSTVEEDMVFICGNCKQPKSFAVAKCIATDILTVSTWDIECYSRVHETPSASDNLSQWRFIPVEKCTWEMKQLSDTFVPVGSDVIPLKEWKKRLREVYCNYDQALNI